MPVIAKYGNGASGFFGCFERGVAKGQKKSTVETADANDCLLYEKKVISC